MIRSDYLVDDEHEPTGNALEFLQKVTLRILNILEERKIPSQSCKFLGTNDVVFFRSKNVMIFCFSRLQSLIKQFLAEYDLSEIEKDYETFSVRKPEYYNLTSTTHENYNKLVDPVNIVFPISYLTLKDQELKNAHDNVASLMIKPIEDDLDKEKRIVKVNPIFHGRNFLKDNSLCFVLMPFKEPYTEIYEKLIKPIVEKEGLVCKKADDIFSTQSVIEDIWENINKASLIIAEITDNNPNVMYELGICHSIGKDVMMITQNPKNIPFNFRHLRTYPYQNDIAKADELKANISSMIQYVKSTQKK